MRPCELCNKIFSTNGPTICPGCLKKLDAVFDKAYTYMRDNPKQTLDSQSLAKALDEDVTFIQWLIDQGRFDFGASIPLESPEEKKRKRLLEELQQSIAKGPGTAHTPRVTYGAGRHGNRS